MLVDGKAKVVVQICLSLSSRGLPCLVRRDTGADRRRVALNRRRIYAVRKYPVPGIYNRPTAEIMYEVLYSL